MDGKSWLIVGLLLAVALLVVNSGGPQPGPVPPDQLEARARAAAQQAVDTLRTRLADALDQQADQARQGRFNSSTDYAQFMEPRGDQAWADAQDVMAPLLAETVGTGEWDAREAEAVSRGLAAGFRGD